MASNNYFGFAHGGTQYAATANASGFPTSQGTAYGVATANAGAGVSAASSFSSQRTAAAVYDSNVAAAYQAAAAVAAVPTPVSYAVTAGSTPVSSYDYNTFAAAAAGRGGVYDASKSYYQQQQQQTAVQVTPSVGGHPANSVVSASTADLQGWQSQAAAYSNRQQNTSSKGVFHATYQAAPATVPTTRQLSVPPIVQKMQASSPSASYITSQQQQYATTVQSSQQQYAAAVAAAHQQQTSSAISAAAAAVGTIGQQPKKMYQQQQVSSSSGNASNYMAVSSSASMGYNTSAAAVAANNNNSQATSCAIGYTGGVVSSGGGGGYTSGYEPALLNAMIYSQQQQGVSGGNYYSNGRKQQYGRTTRMGFQNNQSRQQQQAPFKRPQPKQQQMHYCDACKVSCAGPGAYHDHLQGQKHKKKVAKIKSESSGSTQQTQQPQSSSGQITFLCKLCDVECTAADAYSAHLRGAKHAKVLKLHNRMGKPIPQLQNFKLEKAHDGTDSSGGGLVKFEPNASTGTDEKKFSSSSEVGIGDGSGMGIDGIYLDNRPAVGMEYIEEEKDNTGKLISYNCQLCSCKFSDPNAKEMHVKGRKHRLAFKRKVDPHLKVEMKPNPFKLRDKYANKKSKITAAKRNMAAKSVTESDTTKNGVASASGQQIGSEQQQQATAVLPPLLPPQQQVARNIMTRRAARGGRILAAEVEPAHRIWEQEYRQYEEDLEEYRSWYHRIGNAATPAVVHRRRRLPPPPLGLLSTRDLMMGFPAAASFHPPTIMSAPCSYPSSAAAATFHHSQNESSSPLIRNTTEDKHILAKHKTICPNEQQLKYVEKVLVDVETAMKLVSDHMMKLFEESEKAKLAGKEAAGVGEKEGCNSLDSGYRMLIGMHRVGPFAKTLLLRSDTSLDLVVLCKVKPTLSLLNTVTSCLQEKLLKSAQTEYCVSSDAANAAIVVHATKLSSSPAIFEDECNNKAAQALRINLIITSPLIREEILALEEKSADATTQQDKNNRSSGDAAIKLEITPDPPDILSKTKCLEALAAIRHAKWFQATVIGRQECIVVIRILRDLCRRVPTWAPFDSWPMELLVEKCAASAASNKRLTCGEMLRRVFEALSSGILLADGAGLEDPCEKGPFDAAAHLKGQEREDITSSAQHALRMIAFGQIHRVLGMDQLVASSSGLPSTGKFRSANKFLASRKRRYDNAAASTVKTEVEEKKDRKSADIEVPAEAAVAASIDSAPQSMDTTSEQ